MLDLARMTARSSDGVDDDDVTGDPRLKAVASLHGILAPILPGAGGGNNVVGAKPDDALIGVPRVLVLHATADPFVPPKQVSKCDFL